MVLVRKNAWLQSSTSVSSLDHPASRHSRRRLRGLRAGLAAGLVGLALVAGVAHPAGTSAAKSTSFSCTTLESMFTYADRAAITADLNGLTDQASKWRTTSLYLQGLYLDLDCNTGSLDTAV